MIVASCVIMMAAVQLVLNKISAKLPRIVKVLITDLVHYVSKQTIKNARPHFALSYCPLLAFNVRLYNICTDF